MSIIEYRKDAGEIIAENLTKNIELYNKYTMLLASIFISALAAIGQLKNGFNSWLKISVLLFSFSLAAALLELSLLIIHDSIVLKTIEWEYLKKISLSKYSLASSCLAFFSLIVFLLGIIAVNIFIFSLQG